MRRLALLLCLPLLLLPLAEDARAADWRDALDAQIERIDRATPGELGVYVKRLNGGDTYRHGAERFWYLGSMTKVPIAIAVLQQVDAGKLKLSDSVELQDADRIDVSRVVRERTGRRYTVDALLDRMLKDSDNTAANMLIRTVGEDTVQRSAAQALGTQGFKRITNFATMRRDVYAEIHPSARGLPNTALVQVADAPLGPGRVRAVQRALKLKDGELQARTIDEAYDRYYRHDINAATLDAYGAMLEKLVRGELLQPASLQRLYAAMKLGTFTNHRLQAGLPRSEPFIHKTGTQYERACHAGVLRPQDRGADAVVVAVCAAGMDEHKDVDTIFQQVGRAVAQTALRPQQSAAR